MSTLARHGRDVTSVYDLLGTNENALTAAFGLTLARSPLLLQRVASRLLPGTPAGCSFGLRMEVRDEQGRTDLEIEGDSRLAVVEAKRGWLLPTTRQLAGYAPRVTAAGGGVLATLSNASPQWAAHVLPAQVDGVPVLHLPWSHVREDLAEARGPARGEQRHWLDELHDYLRRAVRVRTLQNSWTYCVVVSRDRPGGGGDRTFRDYVDNGWYFHPFGSGGWPKRPPELPRVPLGQPGAAGPPRRVVGSAPVPARPVARRPPRARNGPSRPGLPARAAHPGRPDPQRRELSR